MSAEGSWKLLEAFDKDEPLEIARNVTVSLKRSGDDAYHVSAKVGNNLSTKLKILGGTAVEGGPCMSTRMLPPPELRELENFVSKALNECNTMEVLANEEKLVLSGPSTKAVLLKLSE